MPKLFSKKCQFKALGQWVEYEGDYNVQKSHGENIVLI